MPVYLLHGFRWPREGLTGIRVRTILQDLEDVSADYIQNAPAQASLLASFRVEYPDIMKNLPDLTLLEQYDPEDINSEAAVCQPYAFVGDRVVTIAGGGPTNIQRPLSGVMQDGTKMPATHGAKKTATGEVQGKAMSPSPKSRDTALSVSVEDVMSAGPATSPEAWEALAELRDKIANGEKIGWFVVFNGDPERHVDTDEEDSEDDEDDDETVLGSMTKDTKSTTPESKSLSKSSTNASDGRDLPIRDKGRRIPGMTAASPTDKTLPPDPPGDKTTSKSEGFKKFFGKKEKQRS